MSSVRGNGHTQDRAGGGPKEGTECVAPQRATTSHTGASLPSENRGQVTSPHQAVSSPTANKTEMTPGGSESRGKIRSGEPPDYHARAIGPYRAGSSYAAYRPEGGGEPFGRTGADGSPQHQHGVNDVQPLEYHARAIGPHQAVRGSPRQAIFYTFS